MKPIFAAAPSASARLALVVIISVALMVADHRFDRVQGLRRAIAVVLTPVQYLVDAPSRLWRWAAESLAERDRLLTENADLREQQLLLRAQTQRLSALESENQRLRELLNSSIEVGDEVLIAELVSVDLNPYSHKILLNRGSFDDVYTGQPVVDARGVVGQVTEVTPLTATVLLITDAQHAIPVQVDRTGLRTIAVGTGRSGVIELPYLPNNADIDVGDVLVTSGLGQRFPVGYPVALVDRVDLSPGRPFAQIEAIPSAELERSREFLLVWPRARTRALAVDG